MKLSKTLQKTNTDTITNFRSFKNTAKVCTLTQFLILIIQKHFKRLTLTQSQNSDHSKTLQKSDTDTISNSDHSKTL